jgi:hypothetical protein
MKKILLSTVLGLSLLVLAGCGTNKASENTQPVSGPKQGGATSETEEKIELPVPTGKVDDTVNAIISEADSEKDQATSDSEDAKSSVGDGQDTTNLSNSYDQNAF